MTLQIELSLEDLLRDPTIGLVMARDRFAPEDIRDLMRHVAARAAEASSRQRQPDARVLSSTVAKGPTPLSGVSHGSTMDSRRSGRPRSLEPRSGGRWRCHQPEPSP